MTRWHGAAGRRPWLWTAWIALALLSFSLLAACGGNGNGDDNSDGDANGGAAATAAADDSDDNGDLEEIEVSILMKDNFFEPDTFTFPVGSRVTFKYENVGLAVHNMIVQSQDLEGENFQSAVAVNPGESGEFVATFTKAGTIPFICVYHLPGMEGTITVE